MRPRQLRIPAKFLPRVVRTRNQALRTKCQVRRRFQRGLCRASRFGYDKCSFSRGHVRQNHRIADRRDWCRLPRADCAIVMRISTFAADDLIPGTSGVRKLRWDGIRRGLQDAVIYAKGEGDRNAFRVRVSD